MELCGSKRRALTETLVFTAAITIELYYYRVSTQKKPPKVIFCDTETCLFFLNFIDCLLLLNT